MKVIEEIQLKPLRIHCQRCHSILELMPKDFELVGDGRGDFVCIVCNCYNRDIRISDDYFYHEAMKCIREKKEKENKRGIASLLKKLLGK